ncbi:MAG: glycosyltransferase [Armatimonadota bacterium]|nr:glycosyltransferase [Armatimonadota bacterium]
MAERARVLILIKGLGVGGAERLLEAAVPHLDRDRYDYRIAYFLPWKNALVPAFERAGIPVHNLAMRVDVDVRVLVRLFRLLRRERIDLIHAHLPVAGVWGRVAARLAGRVRIVYTEHNVPERYARLTRELNRRTYRMNEVVIAVSEEVRKAVAAYANGRPRIVTIQNTVDVDAIAATPVEAAAVRREFGLPEEALLVTTVGNLTPKKGHAHLLAAAAQVAARVPNVRFLLVGQGPLADELRAEADRLRLDGTFVFAGYRADAIRLMAASDLFVLSSLFEGLPVTLLEAMALGKPSVVTRVGGIPEVVDDASSMLVAPGDPAALAEAIAGLLTAPARRAQMGAAAREQARRRYGVGQMVRAVEQVYADVLAGVRS